MEYTKQHFVPQRYLRRFAQQGTRKDKYVITVRRVENGQVRLFPRSIEDVAYLDNCYDDVKQSDPKYWEHLFSRVYEPLYGNPIEKIISKTILAQNGVRILSYEDKLLIGKLTAIQFLRMPVFLAKMQLKGKSIGIEFSKDVRRQFKDRLTSKERNEIDRICISDDSIRSTILSLITDENRTSDYAKIMAKNAMNVIYNNTSIPFCTSDNPVIIYNVSTDSCDFGEGGFARSDTTILYPLSPKVLIQVFDRTLFNDNYDGQRIIINENEISYIIKVNMLQMSHALNESYYLPNFIETINM